MEVDQWGYTDAAGEAVFMKRAHLPELQPFRRL